MVYHGLADLIWSVFSCQYSCSAVVCMTMSFDRFMSISGNHYYEITICKELIMAEDCPQIAVQHITFEI